MIAFGIATVQRLARSVRAVFGRAEAGSSARDDTDDPAVHEDRAADGSTDDRPRPTWETTGDLIERDLKRAGGRMWQRDISSSLDVSQATVSRWLSRLEEQGRVERVELGREKLVVLPGHVPDVAVTDQTPRTAET